MDEKITTLLGQLRSTSGRGDLVDPVVAHIMQQENTVARMAGLIDEQDKLIAAQNALIENYEKQLSLPFFSRLFTKRLKPHDAQ